ncbi:MAG: DNA polymerase I, partial [Spirochaetaceae bacterium]|nr:DNA polymerase I [Spirochaetaceae bacterium]
AFKSGVDVHKATAALIFGVDTDSVTPDMRRTAKTINFGVMYGMSAFRLANELGISRTQAQEFIQAYFATYNGVRSFMDDVISKAEKTGCVETIFGRRRYIRGINSRNKLEKSGAERMAINTPIQGSAADIVKKAMLNVTDELQKNDIPAKLLVQVHDELIFECPEDYVEKAVECIQQTMESVIQLKVPLKVSVETGKRWGDFH